MVGITGFGGYIPRLRLQRATVVAANQWANPGIAALAKGERAMANWDEDAVTLAVEAARDCLAGIDREAIGQISFASTSLPFTDRQNAGIVAAALSLPAAISALDVTGSQRAGTSALIAALSATNGAGHLCVVADKRQARPGSTQELTYGVGAAAVTVGAGKVIADFIGHHSITEDFVDHYRAEGRRFDYYWEERWIRQEGHLKLIPAAISGLLEKTGVAADAIDRLIVPVMSRGAGPGIAKATGIPAEAVADNLQANCGDTGVAHPLVMLVAALEAAKPGERILVAGFGQGADALLFETTDALADYPARRGVAGSREQRREETNYIKYLTFNGLLDMERGMRAEQDKQTALTTLHRNRDMLLGFIGGRCTKCGTLQIPKTRICVNPNCGEHNSQVDEPFAEKPARVMSWTADQLAYSIDPPAHYGMVQFEGGGRLMVDFTDVDPDAVEVDMAIRMVFRIKDVDEARGFVRYFWKAAPAGA
ncbi:MAG: 3-hydroxy-3-methylglutaryl CoA synthase [Alphaproteobacteria bacterium]|nr:3-hydroxy-3-methylglutaryl CoA synthase [Alphaproteobacteria bacterium]